MTILLKNISFLLFSCLLSLQLLNAESLKEGTDFITLQKPIPVEKNTIIELFNVGCPYCASINNVLPNLFALLADEVVFMPYHIITGASFSAQASEVLAVSLILDETHNLSPKNSNSHFKRAADSYFNAIFQQRKYFNNAESFIAHGLNAMRVSRAVFNSTLKDPRTQTLLNTWNASAQYARIQGVPTFIINGKYLILAQGLKSEEDFIYKVDYLLNLD